MPEIPGTMPPPVAPPMPAPPSPAPPGPTAPATVAPDQAGRRMQGMLRASIALNELERAAGLLGGSANEVGADILAAVIKLRKHVGGAAPDLQRQEVKTLAEGIPPVQAPSPQQGQAFQSAAESMMRKSGVPGAPAAA